MLLYIKECEASQTGRDQIILETNTKRRFHEHVQGPEETRGSITAKKGSLKKKGAFTLFFEKGPFVLLEARIVKKGRSIGLLLPHPC